MKKRMLISAVVISMVLQGVALGQTGEREADHQELRLLKTKIATAMNEGDIKALTACLAKEFVLTTIDQTTITNAAQFAVFYARMFTARDAPLASMKIEPYADVLTRFVSPAAGYCYGASSETYTMKDGRAFVMTNRWTALVVKEDGAWKIAAAHGGVNFMDNPVLTASSMSTWRQIGIWLGICTPPWKEAP